MFTIEKPIYFIFLLLIPFAIWAQKVYTQWQKNKQNEFGTQQALSKLKTNENKEIKKQKFILRLFVVFFVVLALVNPKFGSEKDFVKAQGVELVFALDVSKSMLATDIKPNRLEKAKQIIIQTINKLGTDRIGMIAYAGDAYPILPMTTDYALAKMYTQTLTTDIISSQGTAIQNAVERGVNFFDNPNSGKAIILLSDGEDHENNSNITALAEKKGVKIITIGLGTTKGGTITYLDEYGEPKIKKDLEGKTVITKLNEQILQNIASETGGKYISGNQTLQTVEQIKNALENIKKSNFKTQQLAQQKSQFQWFLAISIGLLFLDFFWSENKKVFKILKRRNNEKTL